MDNRDEFEAWYKSEFNREPCPDYGYESDLAWKTWKAARNDAWLLRRQAGTIEEMDKLKCICTLGQSLTGDGCRYCQPQEYIDRLEEWLDEERKDLEQAEARVAELEASVQQFICSGTGPIAVADHKAMAVFTLRKQAEAVEALKDFECIEFGTTGVAIDVVIILKEADRLRQQADEAENG